MKGTIVTLVLALTACGAGTPRVSRELRSQLASTEVEAARERAPELVAAVEAALDEADAAERAGQEAAAQDHATRARLLLEAARNEAARVEDDTERAEVEREIGRILAQARRDEGAREALALEASRRAAARTAAEEGRAALEAASEDEARGPRRRRVSLDEAADLRRAAEALRARARLALASARALGAAGEAVAEAEAALTASAASTDPLEALAAADRAHAGALLALGEVRSARDAPGADATGALAEAASAEGFEAMATPEGLVVEAAGVFAGSSAAVSRRAGPRVERLARLIAAHPHGPVLVQAQAAQAGARGDALAARRAEATRRALVAAGADEGRLSAAPIPGALRADAPLARVRLVFVAYSARP